jgi:hypothetical protein
MEFRNDDQDPSDAVASHGQAGLGRRPAELKPARKNPTMKRLRISIFRFARQDLLSFHEKKM